MPFEPAQDTVHHARDGLDGAATAAADLGPASLTALPQARALGLPLLRVSFLGALRDPASAPQVQVCEAVARLLDLQHGPPVCHEAKGVV